MVQLDGKLFPKTGRLNCDHFVGNAGVDTMLEVNNGWVITDNTWLWTADHCVKSSGQKLGEDGHWVKESYK